MVDITPNQKAFIKEMQHDKEAADYGFELLAKRGSGIELLDALIAEGLLSASNNPAPVSAKEGGYYIPYWNALDYLESVVRRASEQNDIKSVEKVVNVIISVSRGEGDSRGPQDNFHTHRRFAEIIALLPDSALSTALFSEVKSWIKGRFERGAVVAVIGSRLLPRLLSSQVKEHDKLSMMLLEFVSEIKWRKSKDEAHDAEPEALDSYWVGELFKKNASEAGRRLGLPLVSLLRERVRELYSEGTRAKYSWLFRAAVESHPQNHEWRRIDNLLVDALRDALIAAGKQYPGEIGNELVDMYAHGKSIECRIAIYVFNTCFEDFGSRFLEHVDERLLQDECTHEGYHFLQDRFAGLNEKAKARIYELISHMADDGSEKAQRRRMRKQIRWLSAIAHKGSSDADKLYEKLVSDPEGGPPPDNPDLLSVVTSWTGPGPSPYSAQELVLWLEDGSLVERLNSYEPTGEWRGPDTATKRALVEMLALAIKQQPKPFLAVAPSLLKLDHPYQYAFLSAFSDLWLAEPKTPTGLQWNEVWKLLLDWMHQLFDAKFWSGNSEEARDLTPSRDWIPPLAADLIKAGTRDDDHAFDASLLPAAYAVLVLLLKYLPASKEPPEQDPMHEAINAARGRVIEAFFNLSLRWCRVADQTEGRHDSVWEGLAEVFAAELKIANGANFEFTTHAACLVSHIQYMSPEWFEKNYSAILSPTDDESFKCVVSGLMYAPADKTLYELLLKVGTLDRALHLPESSEKTRDHMLERIALAYLWKQETLETKQVSGLLSAGREHDLAVVAAYFWSVSNQELSKEQVALIVKFWNRAARWALKQDRLNGSLLGSLAKLICYLDVVDGEATELIVALAPFASANSMSYFFVKELKRLVKASPASVAEAALAYLKQNGPEYDYENLWLEITRELASAHLKIEAIEVAEIMRGQPGFDELYRTIQ